MGNLLTPQEVADWLNVKLPTLYKWTCANSIPHIKLSRKLVRFDEEELKGWLQKKTCSISAPRCPTTGTPQNERKKQRRDLKAHGIDHIIESAKREVLG
ncbi:MAG: helix-turn-helix domain-containing protein [Dissulfurispiraceae bacterium]